MNYSCYSDSQFAVPFQKYCDDPVQVTYFLAPIDVGNGEKPGFRNDRHPSRSSPGHYYFERARR